MPTEPSVKRDLQATADLLDALQQEPALLDDPDFMRRLSILRQKHEETTNFLARKLGAPPLMTTSGKKKTLNVRTMQVANQHHLCDGFHYAQVQHHDKPTTSKSHTTVRREDSSSTSQSTVREILSKATEKYHLPKRLSQNSIATSSVAMPSGLLLSNSVTKNAKHIGKNSGFKNTSQTHQNSAIATSSHVVEESFLSDGLSTTREVSTIVDEIVDEVPQRAKVSDNHGRVPEIRWRIDRKRSKSMQNVAEPRSEYVPKITVPKPFQLTLRKTISNTYAKKFMSDMMEEKKQKETEEIKIIKSTKFVAKSVPKSTYVPTNTFVTEIKYVEAMRRKVAAVAKKKFDAQNEMVRSKSEGNLAIIKPLGYIPPSTYISPIPVKPNARSRSATTRSAILIQEATTPKGIKSHRHTSNLTHNLRHGKCKIDSSAGTVLRRTSPPDFNKIHAQINKEYRKTNSKPSTVPIPFKFESRSQSANPRHTNCQVKEPEMFHKSWRSQSDKKKQVPRVPSTHAAQLREELSKAKKEKADSSKEEFWKEENRKRIATFLGARSKTEEDIAIRTRRKIQQQQETTQDYMRQLAQMKQRVLNGPLIMEKQTALAQEHRLKRKFEQRMRASHKVVSTTTMTASASKTSPKDSVSSRRNSESSQSAAGTFVVEKVEEYDDDFENGTSSKNSDESEDESETEFTGSSASRSSSDNSKSSGSRSDS
uniref:Uncharacterized protein n=1 Tax=Caenorhabditis japonica TaxID=281687 RepID=A0A8R1HSE8_CAEJA